MSKPGKISDGSTCNRFEEEALLRREQGLRLDAHFDTCPACDAARASYEQLYDGLRDLGRAHAGRPDWQARVWAGIARRPVRRPGPRLWWIAMPVAAAAAGSFLLLRPPPGPAGPALALALQPTGRDIEATRGDHAKPGDTLAIHILTGGAAQAELRVYRDEHELIVRCTDEPPCTRRGDEITAAVVLGERGRYHVAFLHGAQSLPAPTQQLDQDLVAARAAGAAVNLRDLDVL